MKSAAVTVVIAVIAWLVAYFWVAGLFVLVVIAAMSDASTLYMGTAIVVAIAVGMRLVLPGLCRFVIWALLGLQQWWAERVFDVWRVIETKRTIAAATRSAGVEAFTEDRPVDDLGRERDA